MKKLLFLLCFLWISDAQAIEPKVPQANTIEVNEIINWVPEEVPRTVTFYIDTDGDGLTNIIVAYSLIEALPCRTNCVHVITDNGDHWLLPSPGINYYVIKEWIVFKYKDNEEWRGEHTTSDWIFLYPMYEDWYDKKFLKLWPNTARRDPRHKE